MDAPHEDEPAAKKQKTGETGEHGEGTEVETAAQPPPSSSTPELRASSALENLPRELLWKVLEYVPEAALELSVSSKLLQHCVDVYAAKHVNIPMVRLTLGNCKLPGTAQPEDQMNVTMNIFDETKGLFYRRLKFLRNTLGLKSAHDEFMGLWTKTDGKMEMPMTMPISITFDNIDGKIAFFSECISRRIRQVQLIEIKTEPIYAHVEKILAGKQINHLRIVTNPLKDDTLTFYSRVVSATKVDNLEMVVTKFDTTTDTLELLREFSAQVHTLHITQHTDSSDANRGGSFLFGKSGAEWVPMIMEIFRGKVDKLIIENKNNTDYISLNDAEALIERIPELGKRVWFEASCDHFVTGHKASKNGYAIEVGKKGTKASLRIKHISRGPLEEVKP